MGVQSLSASGLKRLGLHPAGEHPWVSTLVLDYPKGRGQVQRSSVDWGQMEEDVDSDGH